MLREDVSVLVIDDVNTMRIQIRELLRGLGFRKILVASNGEEAKQLFKKVPIHLVLSDWHMEPGNGLALLEFIRKDPELQNIAFIMVTAENTKERVMQAIQAGVDDYLMKPLTVQQVQTKVYGVLLRKQVLS